MNTSTMKQSGLPPGILQHFYDLRAMAMAASAMTIVIEGSRSEFRDVLGDELNAMRRVLTCLGDKALEFADEADLFLMNFGNTQTTQGGDSMINPKTEIDLGELCDLMQAMQTLMPKINFGNQVDMDTGILPLNVTMSALLDKAQGMAKQLYEQEQEGGAA